jgi:outer membrane protein assembly factor BamB
MSYNHRSRVIAALAIALALSAGGRPQARPAENWPGLWGPTRNGESPAASASPPRTAKELWRRTTAGGYSEIAIANGRAVTMEMRDGDDFVVAFDAASGKEIWSARVGPTYRGHGGSHDGPIATPTLAGDDVFAAGPHGQLVALDMKTGKERWRHDLAASLGATMPRWGFAASPLVEAGLVVLPAGGESGGGLLAFDRASGRLVWSAPHTKSTSYSSAVAATIAGTRQILTASSDRIFAVSPEDGRLLWSVSGPGTAIEVSNSPLVLPGDRVLLTFWEHSQLIKIARKGDALSASEIWQSPRLRAFNGPTIFRDGHLFGFAGPQLVCLDAATGEVRWRERTGEGSLLGMGSHLFLLGQTSGELRVVGASPSGYTEAFRMRIFTPDVTSVTGLSFADDRLYARNIREMVAFDLER